MGDHGTVLAVSVRKDMGLPHARHRWLAPNILQDIAVQQPVGQKLHKTVLKKGGKVPDGHKKWGQKK